MGISILPAPACQNEVRAGTLITRPLEGTLRRPIAAIQRRGREPSLAAQALLDSFAADLR